MDTKEFATEWCLLQNQYDSYEKHSLYIKLVAIIVLLLTGITDHIDFVVVGILLLLWLQDAIWKTFQARTETRLLALEKHIAGGDKEQGGEKGVQNESDAVDRESPFQFNSQYHRARLRGLSLINEYARQSLRPTVAFPHIVLMLISLVEHAV